MNEKNPDTESDTELLSRIEEMIKTHISQIEELSGQTTDEKDIINDIFVGDATYQKHDEAAKETIRIRTNTKKEIMKRPDVADHAEKLKSLRSQKKELEEGLSDYLREYQRLSGSNEFEGDDGEVREIVYVAKLVKKSGFKP